MFLLYVNQNKKLEKYALYISKLGNVFVATDM